MILNKKILVSLSIVYLYIPIFLFIFGWTKSWVVLVCDVALSYCIVRMMIDYIKNEDTPLKIKIVPLVFCVSFLLLIGYFAGWGRWVNQAYDWNKHNAVLKDLATKSWPVYYKNGSEHSMLTYYIAQYLVPATFGKLFNSFRIAEIVNYVWAEVGLILVWINLIRVLNIKNSIKQIASVVILIFFSGPLWLAQAMQKFFYNINNIGDMHWLIRSLGIQLQYSSNYTLIRWVFPQIIVIWLVLLLFIENKEKIQYYIPLILPSMLFGTLSFIGILPLAVGSALYQLIRERKVLIYVRKFFSLENILTLLTLGSLFILYFYGNVTGKKSDDISLQITQYKNFSGVYVIFVLVMVLLYSVCIWKDNKRNELFYLAVLSLLVLPLFQMGLFNDLVLRCSIPGLFILMYYVIKFLNTHIHKNMFRNTSVLTTLTSTIVCVILLVGGYYPWLEFYESVKTNRHEAAKETNYGSMEKFANRQLSDIPSDLKYNYYTYDIEDNLFYKFIARNKMI